MSGTITRWMTSVAGITGSRTLAALLHRRRWRVFRRCCRKRAHGSYQQKEHNDMLRWSEFAYGWLLWLYPAEFRHEYAGQMQLVFQTRSAAERERRGALGLIMLWLDGIADLAPTAPKEHAHMLAQDILYAVRVLMKE